MNKNAIELSVNFLIVIILSIVMLGLGIKLITQFLGTAEEITAELDVRTEEELSNMLNEGQIVAVAFNRQTMAPGDSKIFGLGILNVLDETKEFGISVEVKSAYSSDFAPIANSAFSQSCADCIRYEKTKTIQKDSSEKMAILVSLPKQGVPKGTYILDVRVTAPGLDTPYGLNKIYVVV